METSYLYKVYRDGAFLGLIPNVTSPFKYGLNINSAGASLEIAVGANPYEAPEDVEEFITEDGDTMITEDGDIMTTERRYPIYGNEHNLTLIRNGNDVEVFEISETYPESHKVFEGYISRWRPNFGGTGEITCTVLSYGVELDNYIIQGAPTLDQSQTSQNDNFTMYEPESPGSGFFRVGQTFIAGSTVDNVTAIAVRLAAVDVAWPQTVTVKLWALAPVAVGDTSVPLATATRVVSSTTPAEYLFTFTTPPTIQPGQSYFFTVQGIDEHGVIIYFQDSNVYANGGLYFSQDLGGGSGHPWTTSELLAPPGVSYDLYFKTYYSSGATEAAYSSQDPTAIVRAIVDSYVSRGGNVNYDGSSTDLTGTSRSYTFKLNTILEGIKKMLDISPSNWYWFVDPADSVLYFKQTPTTATHTMILGDHITELDLEVTIENLTNIVYFSGGDTGSGENLFMTDSDTESLASFPQGLGRISDNRVTVPTTAQAFMDNVLDNFATEAYITILEIPAAKYDISLFNPGETIGFAGFGNFVDDLILQIASLTRETDRAILALGVLPKRASEAIETALREIDELQTINNPNAPS